MSFLSGESVGPYQILDLVGQGGMAAVYKAYHRTLDRYVAIKVIHPALINDNNFLARFQREAKVIARLDHPNIVPIYDFAEHDGRPYIVMKFIEGEPLKALMENHPLAYNEIMTILEAVSRALSYAHKQKILHRDIKPSNVLLSKDGQIYLADFGLARLIQTGETTISKDGMVGTPQYMSPEQALGRPDLDERTDIYSLGIMLYEMVLGQVPYHSDSPYTIIHDHIYTPLPLPRQVNPDIPEPLEGILIKALAKDPGERFQDVDALCSAFRFFLESKNENVVSSEVKDPNSAQTREGGHSSQAFKDVPAPFRPTPIVPINAGNGKPIQDMSNSGRKTTRLIFGGAAGATLVIICLIAGVWAISNRNAKHEMEQTQIAQTMVSEAVSGMLADATRQPGTLEPEQVSANIEEAKIALDAAASALKEGKRDVVLANLKRMRDAAGQDIVFYETVVQQLITENNWVLAAMVLNQMPVGISQDYGKTYPNFIHQVLYMAAGEPASRDFPSFLMARDVIQVSRVAVLRHELFFGSRQKAKEGLGKILSDPNQLKNFPEAFLLEAEIYINSGDLARARQTLESGLEKPDQLPWISDFARQLLEKN